MSTSEGSCSSDPRATLSYATPSTNDRDHTSSRTPQPTVSHSYRLPAAVVAAPPFPLQLEVPPTSSEQEGPSTWDGTPQDTFRFEHPLSREREQLDVLSASFAMALHEYQTSESPAA